MKPTGAPQSEILQRDIPYVPDPLVAFSRLTDRGRKKHSLLLESAEIETKQHTKSVLLLDAALEIRCHGLAVSVRALSANGGHLLPLLRRIMPVEIDVQHLENGLRLGFPPPPRGLDEAQRLKALSPLHILRLLLQSITPRQVVPQGIFIGGIFGYDMVATFESLPAVEPSANPCPDMLFYLAETLLVVDHVGRSSRLIGTVFGGRDCPSRHHLQQRIQRYADILREPNDRLPIAGEAVGDDEVRVNVSDQDFCRQVRWLKESIVAGEIFQVVPSRSFSVRCADGLLAYQQLRASNPSPYMFYLNAPDFQLFGASPESAVKYDAKRRRVEVYPIAGTRRRGTNAAGRIDPDLDSRLELDLRYDEKEVAEHMMLVDLARNDVARISAPGSRHVAKLLKVDRYSHVMHLVSLVVGRLQDGLDALHAYQGCMNMGTLVGAPKIRAAELIRQVEKTRRGSYGGAIGYLDGTGDMDTCIVIRSGCVVNRLAHIQAGAGIVYDSEPQAEADETRQKAQAVIQAVLAANRIVRQNHWVEQPSAADTLS